MALTSSALAALLAASCAAVAAAATTYTVGDGQGWVNNFDYNGWTSGKMFFPGDQLVFNYMRGAHTVTEVNRNGFDSCSGSNAMSNDDSGSTTITLSYPGTRYFICTVPGHCTSGMKLAINVAGGGPGGYYPPYGGAGGARAPAVGSVVAAAVIKLALL